MEWYEESGSEIFGKPIRFLPSMVSACLCHSEQYCVVPRKWWTIWSVERKTESPWTGDIIWDKTSTLSSKPLNWQFTSGSTSCLMENGTWILRREEWPWVFTNGKNWKRPFLYLKKENQNRQLTMCKINYRNLYMLFVIIIIEKKKKKKKKKRKKKVNAASIYRASHKPG